MWLEGKEPKRARGEIGAGRSFVKGGVIVQTYCQGQGKLAVHTLVIMILIFIIAHIFLNIDYMLSPGYNMA